MMLDEYGVRVSGPLAQRAHEFASGLAGLGYVRGSIRSALFVFAFVSEWLGTRRLRAGDLTSERVERLRRARRSGVYRYSLSKVLRFLRGVGVVPGVRPVAKRTGLDRLVDRYREYRRRRTRLVGWSGALVRHHGPSIPRGALAGRAAAPARRG